MRRLVLLLTIVTACDQGARPSDVFAGPSWQHIVELAKPLTPPGPRDQLLVALALQQPHLFAWNATRGKAEQSGAPIGLADFPGAEPVIAALERWSAEGGSIPPYVADGFAWVPRVDDPLAILALGVLAARTATTAEQLLAAATLGQRLLTEGSTLVYAMLGCSILKAAARQSIALDIALPASVVPPRIVIARAFATELVWEHDTRPAADVAELGPVVEALARGDVAAAEQNPRAADYVRKIVDALDQLASSVTPSPR